METARLKLQELHEYLYEKAKDEALSYPSFRSNSVKEYANSYQKSLPETFENSTIDNVLESFIKSRVLLYADFHTLRQTQKGFIRFLRHVLLKKPDQKITVMLEAFRASDQNILERYTKNEMTEEEFLDRTDYFQSWGFPWENYEPILRLSQNGNLKFKGLNTDRCGRDSLEDRDEFAANLIEKTIEDDPEQIVICLIGEYHLGDMNLVRHFNELSPTRLFTNVDKYYFESRSMDKPSEYLFLKDNAFCLINSPPWIKWQSYCLWEETRNSLLELTAEDDEHYTEEGLDLEYQTHYLTHHIANFTKLNLSNLDLSRFSIEANLSENTHFDTKISSLNKAQQKQVKEGLDKTGFYFDLKTNSILIQDVSLNNLAEISGRYLHNIISKIRYKQQTPEDFIFRILNQASGTVASKILNPKQKSYDFSILLECKSQNDKFIKNHQLELQDARKITKLILAGSFDDTDFTTIYKKDLFQNHRISSLLGKILGYSIYNFAIDKKGSLALIQELFLSNQIEGERAFLQKTFKLSASDD